MERKQVAFELTNIDGEGRTMEGYAAAFGNLDMGGDIIHPGAFTKTLNERGQKVKFLWQHDPGEPIGKPIEMREDARGLFIKALISDTQRGRDAIALLKDGAIGEMSIGYEAIKGGTDYTKEGGKTVRNLREIKLWEFSLVTFPMNPEAEVTGLKAMEGKPWRAVREGNVWNVYKLDADGNITGDSLGEHDSEESAAEQVRALYASEEGDKEKDKSASGYVVPEHLIPELEEMIKTGKGSKATIKYKAGRVLSMRNIARIKNAIQELQDALMEAGVSDAMDIEEAVTEMVGEAVLGTDDEMMDGGKSADNGNQEQAGPPPAPTPAEVARAKLNILESELSTLEV